MTDQATPVRFRAAILERNNAPLALDEVTFPGPLLPGQVLVEVHYSGICGKQIEEIIGTAGPDRFLPHMLGHEGSGKVVAIGPKVDKVQPGDTVVLHWMKGSGVNADTPWYVRGGKRVNAGWVTTFNEMAVVSENRVTPVPPGKDMELACLLGCAVSTGLGIVRYEAQWEFGDQVAVFGCGGVGLTVIHGAVLYGASQVVAVDTNADALERASRFGASHTVLADHDPMTTVRAVRKICPNGASLVVAALRDPKAIQAAVESASAPGEVFFVGIPPMGSKIVLDPLSIHRGRVLKGSIGGATYPDRDIPLFLNRLRRGLLRLDEMVGRIRSFEEINDAIDDMIAGAAGRQILRMPAAG